MSIAVAFAADKQAPFRAPAVTSLAHRQANQLVTIGVEPYDAGEKVKVAFGKVVPYDYGVLPVLVVIQNDSGQTIRLDRMKAEYLGPRGDRVVATPAKDVRYARPVARPRVIEGPRGPVPLRSKKNPLDAWEIENRALVAQLLPPGQVASGFLYFQTGIEKGGRIYLNGLSEAGSGRELFYFEIPLD